MDTLSAAFRILESEPRQPGANTRRTASADHFSTWKRTRRRRFGAAHQLSPFPGERRLQPDGCLPQLDQLLGHVLEHLSAGGTFFPPPCPLTRKPTGSLAKRTRPKRTFRHRSIRNFRFNPQLSIRGSSASSKCPKSLPDKPLNPLHRRNSAFDYAFCFGGRMPPSRLKSDGRSMSWRSFIARRVSIDGFDTRPAA